MVSPVNTPLPPEATSDLPLAAAQPQTPDNGVKSAAAQPPARDNVVNSNDATVHAVALPIVQEEQPKETLKSFCFENKHFIIAGCGLCSVILLVCAAAGYAGFALYRTRNAMSLD